MTTKWLFLKVALVFFRQRRIYINVFNEPLIHACKRYTINSIDGVMYPHILRV